jgi:hypothetical protein
MKRTLLVLALTLIAACAPQEHDLGTEAGPQAGAVALKTEALLPSCSEDSFKSALRSQINSSSGVTWTWSGSATSSPWAGTGSGGRTIAAYRTVIDPALTNFRTRHARPSQASWFYVTGKCIGTNQVQTWKGLPAGHED